MHQDRACSKHQISAIHFQQNNLNLILQQLIDWHDIRLSYEKQNAQHLTIIR